MQIMTKKYNKVDLKMEKKTCYLSKLSNCTKNHWSISCSSITIYFGFLNVCLKQYNNYNIIHVYKIAAHSSDITTR